MKEFIDKLISRLREERTNADDEALVECGTNGHTLDFEYLNGRCGAYNHSIDIVNELAEEYINTSTEHINCSTEVSEMPTGWIPCERELPKEDKRVLCQGKNGMFIGFVDSFDGEWRDNHHYRRTAVKAWCELPAPYTEGE